MQQLPESTLTKDYLGRRRSKIRPLRRVSDPEGNDLTPQKQGLRWQQKQQDLINVAIRVRLITSAAPRCVTRTQNGWNVGTEEGHFWAVAHEVVDGSGFNVQQARLTKHPLNKVSKLHVSEMLISAALLPPVLRTAGSLPSLWLFNAGPSQAQTS